MGMRGACGRGFERRLDDRTVYRGCGLNSAAPAASVLQSDIGFMAFLLLDLKLRVARVDGLSRFGDARLPP